jgi:hypothetical protein
MKTPTAPIIIQFLMMSLQCPEENILTQIPTQPTIWVWSTCTGQLIFNILAQRFLLFFVQILYDLV